MHPMTFQARCKKMKFLLEKHLRYQNDFMEEKYRENILCTVCDREKPRYLFFNDKRKQNGKTSYCKLCIASKCRQRKLEWTDFQFIKNLLSVCRSSTRRRKKIGRTNMMYNITIEHIMALKVKQKNKCIYSGVELIWKQNHPNTVSIDRIDSSLGYISSNIQLVTKQINAAKSNMSDEEFKTLIYNCYMTMKKTRQE